MSAPTRTRPTNRPSARSSTSSASGGARVTSLLTRTTIDLDEPYADDPQPRGRRLRATKPPGRRSKSFVTLLALVMTLNWVGLTMILSASSVMSNENTGSPFTMFWKQLGWFLAGLVAMIATMRRDYRRWSRHAGYGVVGVLVLLSLVIVAGRRVNGAKRWLGFDSFNIQPSEIAKLALIVFWADLLSRRAKWIDDARLTFFPVVLTCGVTAGLIMLQPNLGTVVIIFFIMLAMVFVAGTPLRWIGAVVASGGVMTLAFLVLSPWRAARLEAFRDPWADSQGTGFQILNAQAAVANGGPTGTGLGESRAKWGFLPEANTDFIFAILAEEAGLIGALLVIALFIAMALTGIRVAMKAPDRFGMLLATGITTWFLVQAFFNIGQSIGALPVMGVPLPFVSAGGSSLVVGMVAVGMLLNIARQTRV
jgi:cell division protein FtsW